MILFIAEQTATCTELIFCYQTILFFPNLQEYEYLIIYICDIFQIYANFHIKNSNKGANKLILMLSYFFKTS